MIRSHNGLSTFSGGKYQPTVQKNYGQTKKLVKSKYKHSVFYDQLNTKIIEKITTYKLKTKYVLMVEKIYNNIFYIGKTTSV